MSEREEKNNNNKRRVCYLLIPLPPFYVGAVDGGDGEWYSCVGDGGGGVGEKNCVMWRCLVWGVGRFVGRCGGGVCGADMWEDFLFLYRGCRSGI